MLGELTTSNATNTYKGSTTRAQNFREWRRASLIRVRENPIKGCYGEKANRHPHWGRRRPWPQLGHKDRHLPQQRERYRGPRAAPRLGGTDAPEPRGSGQPAPLRHAARPREHAHHRPSRWHGAALQPYQPSHNGEAARPPRRQGFSALRW